MDGQGYFVHESSFVDEPCQIGPGTKIWHFSHVMKDSVIGRDCNIGQNVLVASGVRMGDGCKIQNNVSLYTGVVLEDHVFPDRKRIVAGIREAIEGRVPAAAE